MEHKSLADRATLTGMLPRLQRLTIVFSRSQPPRGQCLCISSDNNVDDDDDDDNDNDNDNDNNVYLLSMA